MRPYVRINMAMSADGKVATANRAAHTFGSPRDGRHLHELRAGADAIICGARTIEETGATLGNGGPRFDALRLRLGRQPRPVRVVVSGSASISPDAALWGDRSSPIIAWVGASAPRRRVEVLSRLADEIWMSPGDDIDVKAGLRWLATRHQVRDALLEGGGFLNDAFFRAGVVDELHLTWCPLLMGGAKAPTAADGLGFDSIAQATRLRLDSINRHGDELFLVYRSRRKQPRAVAGQRGRPPAS
ncbi:MAG: RibD family protein [Verrucomicrobiota bacterium]|jgi:riboflavin-specific deaminase-like protein